MNPYFPDQLPPDNLDYKYLLPYVGKANSDLAQYNGLLQSIVNPQIMLSPLTTQEAVLSSKIEGTQATVDEVLEQEAGIIKKGEKYHDINEIVNYRNALRAAQNHLSERPISLSFIRALHKILLQSVRGQDKAPGEFRSDQNWIGRPGCSIENATFVPPNPLTLQDHLRGWEDYCRSDDLDALLQTAIVHAQFELIHPFKDGNGRIGRILIPLFLYRKKKLSQPMFYLSGYLESNRDSYYHRLQAISLEKDWNGWIAFFLNAISQQAQINSRKVREILNLYDNMKNKVPAITHSQFGIQLVDALFDSPIFNTTAIIKKTGITKPTALGLIRQLKQAGILEELVPHSGRRAAVLAFPKLLLITDLEHRNADH